MTPAQIEAFDKIERLMEEHFQIGLISVDTGVAGEWCEGYYGDPTRCLILAKMITKSICDDIIKSEEVS
jgi:hypothetical protein